MPEEEKTKTKESEAKDETQEEKQKLLELSGVSILLDTYDDIFSDFDPRPYSQRSLSDDFLREGWFTTWFALDWMFYATEKKKPDLIFTKRCPSAR